MADGTAPAVTITPTWDITDLRFPLSSGDKAVLTITHNDSRVDTFLLEGDPYSSMLQAVQVAANPTVEATIVDAKGNPDIPRLYRYRLATWVAKTYFPGYNAQPT